MGFLDFTRLEDRERACRRGVELNQRLSPDAYLGVLDVSGPDGEPCDHLVVMRRMPAHRRLAAVRQGHDVEEGVRQVARLIAAFHARAETSSAIAGAASVEAVLGNWEGSLPRWPGSSVMWPKPGAGDPETGRCRDAGHVACFCERPWSKSQQFRI